MCKKRFKLEYLEYEPYYIDNDQEYIDKDEMQLQFDGLVTMSDEQVLYVLNEQYELNQKLLNALMELKEIGDYQADRIEELSKYDELIDKKIKELEERYKFGQEVYRGCPMHNIMFGINVLREIQKEFEEYD